MRIGSDYGGWWVPADLLDKYSICYLAGVGEDTTFDEGLIERFGCDVWAFDPTPRAIAHAATVTNRGSTSPTSGCGASPTTMQFYAPADPNHVSHSIANLQETDDYFEAPVRDGVRGDAQARAHDEIDLLKLDIEGAEGPVLERMLDDGITPRVLCIELDAVEPPWRSLALLRRLHEAGYEVNHVEDRNYTLTLT